VLSGSTCTDENCNMRKKKNHGICRTKIINMPDQLTGVVVLFIHNKYGRYSQVRQKSLEWRRKQMGVC